MIVVRMQQGASARQIQEVVERLQGLQAELEVVPQAAGTALVVRALAADDLAACRHWPGVARVKSLHRPYPLVSRDWHPESTEVRVGDVVVGGGAGPVVVAGPCSVESEEQIHIAARAVKAAGAHLLRGGAFKPRTNPYSFQGLGERGLQLLREAGQAVGLPVVTEVMSPGDVDLVASYSDILQVGTRNMANFELLRAAGRSDRAVLLKRGMAATVDEWLQAAEYIVSAGNERVILCERGIRSFDPSTRNTLDLAAAVLAQQRSHLPVVVDPSHGTGLPSLIHPMSLAAVAAGVDGICLEMHPNPAVALSDGDQALRPEELLRIVQDVTRLSEAMGSLGQAVQMSEIVTG